MRNISVDVVGYGIYNIVSKRTGIAATTEAKTKGQQFKDIIMVRLSGKLFNIIFINAYVPSEYKSNQIGGEFYEQIERLNL